MRVKYYLFAAVGIVGWVCVIALAETAVTRCAALRPRLSQILWGRKGNRQVPYRLYANENRPAASARLEPGGLRREGPGGETSDRTALQGKGWQIDWSFEEHRNYPNNYSGNAS